MFVGSRTLEPLVLESGTLSPEMRLIVADTHVPRGTGSFRVPLTATDDVARFMELVRIKWIHAAHRRANLCQRYTSPTLF